MSNDVLWHGDGCDTPMNFGHCPRCNFSPSMQDTFFAPLTWKPKVREGHQAARDYKTDDRIVVTNGEMTIYEKRGSVVLPREDDAPHHVRVRMDNGEVISLHQNDVKPIFDIVDRIAKLA